MLKTEILNRCMHCRIQIGKVNVFAPEDIRELDDLITRCEKLYPETVRALCFESDCISPGGKKIFCAGANQKVREGWSDAQILEYLEYQRHVIHRLRLSPLCVICCVDGLALGLGAEICLASDFVLAGEDAAFGFPEKDWGIVPGAGGYAWAYGWAENQEFAQQVIRLGTPIDREHARYVGLADMLCDSEDLGMLADAFVAELMSLEPEVQSARKKTHHEKIDYEKYFEAEQNAYQQCLEKRRS